MSSTYFNWVEFTSPKAISLENSDSCLAISSWFLASKFSALLRRAKAIGSDGFISKAPLKLPPANVYLDWLKYWSPKVRSRLNSLSCFDFTDCSLASKFSALFNRAKAVGSSFLMLRADLKLPIARSYFIWVILLLIKRH